MELSKFFRDFLPITPIGDIWEGQFNLIYYTKGGVTLEQAENMKRNKFLWFLKRLRKQKVDENKAIANANKPVKSRPTDKRKYLGNV